MSISDLNPIALWSNFENLNKVPRPSKKEERIIQFMVDFGDASPTIGDEVLVFGKRKEDYIPVEHIAKKINTTTYVLLTAIHGRTEYLVT